MMIRARRKSGHVTSETDLSGTGYTNYIDANGKDLVGRPQRR